MTVYARPGAEDSLMSFQPRYDNYVGGEWVAPAQGRFFENPSPVTGLTFSKYRPAAGATHSPPMKFSYRD